MTRLRPLLLAALLSLPSAAFAQSQPPDASAPGRSDGISGVVQFGYAHLQLPPGNWILVGEGANEPGMSGGGMRANTIATRLYAQVENKRIASFLMISANTEYLPGGWRAPKECARTNVYLNDSPSKYDRSFDCMIVNHYVMRLGNSPSDLWKKFFDFVKIYGGMPKQFVYVQYEKSSSNRGNFLNLRVFFNPELVGLSSPDGSWSASPWHTSNLTAERKAYLDKIAVWAGAYRPTFEAALD